MPQHPGGQPGQQTPAPQVPGQTPSTERPETTSPTADDDAAAANVASNLDSLSGATGTPSTPASPTPNAIGDFFGAPGDRLIIQQPSQFGSIAFFPVGGTIANFGESIPSQPVAQVDTNTMSVIYPNSPVVFAVTNSSSGFTSVNSQGQVINRGQIGFLNETSNSPADILASTDRFDQPAGTYFLVNAGDALTQNNLQLAALQSQSQSGSVTLLGGRATLHSEDGQSDGLSNVNGPVIGDLNGDGDTGDPGEFISVGDQFYLQQFYLFTPEPIVLLIPNPGSGGTVGKVKLADNNSARPQNRVFIDYQYFRAVPILAGGADVRRITTGIEKTFNGPAGMLGSVEVIVPMAVTISSDLIADGANSFSSSEFGNLGTVLKLLFYERPNLQMAAGAALTFPTADDVTLSRADGTSLIRVSNESVHLVPYVAALFTPTFNLFGHAFAQLDYDFNGSPVDLNADGTGLRRAGRISDQTVMFLDSSAGYWLYRNDNRWFSGVAGMAELHYNKTLEQANSVASGNLAVGDRNASLDLLNATLGGHVRAGQTIVTNGVSFPITQSDAVFDWEYRLFVNRYY